MTEARASAIFRSFHRTSSHPSIRRSPVLLVSTLSHPGNAITRLRRLHAFSPFAAPDIVGRAALAPRRVRRGGLAYPMSASRARWYPRQSRHVLPV